MLVVASLLLSCFSGHQNPDKVEGKNPRFCLIWKYQIMMHDEVILQSGAQGKYVFIGLFLVGDADDSGWIQGPSRRRWLVRHYFQIRNSPNMMLDLWSLHADDTANRCFDAFNREWRLEVRRPSPSFNGVFLRSFGASFIVGGVFCAITCVLEFARYLPSINMDSHYAALKR
jgi:hypothetical protein